MRKSKLRWEATLNADMFPESLYLMDRGHCVGVVKAYWRDDPDAVLRAMKAEEERYCAGTKDNEELYQRNKALAASRKPDPC